MSVTRIDDRKVEIVKTPIVLDELIDSVLMKFEKKHPSQRVETNIPDEFIDIPMDSMLIEQVLMNLLENAVLHAKGMTRLGLTVRMEGTDAVFEVSDDGCGIPNEIKEGLFTGSFVDSGAPVDGKRNNMGIGLSVCTAIVRAHGGDLTEENNDEGGATFRFSLKRNGIDMGNNKYKILVIEDEDNIASFIRTNLEINNYQVICAGTCEMGLRMFSSHHPDLVVLDLGLPDRDGLEFIQEIRKSETIPIIVLSARTSENEKVFALDLGANDYITKPFGTEELLARIRAVLRSNRRCSELGSIPGGRFQLKDMVIDYDKRQVTIKGNEIDLTQTEYNIVAYLSEHAGKVLTYASIIQAIWGYSDYGSTKKLQVNMKNIRKKMGVTPGERRYIINELGVGYRMMEE